MSGHEWLAARDELRSAGMSAFGGKAHIPYAGQRGTLLMKNVRTSALVWEGTHKSSAAGYGSRA